MKDLHLITFEANSFAGIDSESPVIIDFTAARKNQGITILKGDQGTRKTSTLYALMSLMGATFNFDTKNFINKKDETIDTVLEFTHNKEKYQVKQTGSRLTLKKWIGKPHDRWVPESSPKETLRTIFGNLGVSPMFLKDLPGKKQIEWFKTTFGSDEEASKKEVRKTNDLRKAMDVRKEANRLSKEIGGWLAQNDLYENYEANQKKFATTITAEKEQKKLEELQVKKSAFDKAVIGLSTLESAKTSLEEHITRLEEQVAEERKKLQEIKDRVEDGKKYIAASNGITKEFDAANQAFMNINKLLVKQSQWKEVVQKKKELDEADDLRIQSESNVDKLRNELLELASAYLPTIPGLENRVKGLGIDDGDDDEGIFFQGKSLAQLSESELWDLFLQIWEEKDVHFVYAENINALGSQATATLNRLVKEKKAQVFASEVDRSKDTMEISFTTKID